MRSWSRLHANVPPRHEHTDLNSHATRSWPGLRRCLTAHTTPGRSAHAKSLPACATASSHRAEELREEWRGMRGRGAAWAARGPQPSQWRQARGVWSSVRCESSRWEAKGVCVCVHAEPGPREEHFQKLRGHTLEFQSPSSSGPRPRSRGGVLACRCRLPCSDARANDPTAYARVLAPLRSTLRLSPLAGAHDG